ncbi:hypothetical protein NDU88_005062 [Pleurodeles waltl]|uniref:Uncharacterized protein n=1 Tax=Pleurodeles waltl TaxID=8319 RepID=A0AAV7UI40_PLEWA|nr:hypothetical protein NDU88_005062 [Pleurodeles waltl]
MEAPLISQVRTPGWQPGVVLRGSSEQLLLARAAPSLPIAEKGKRKGRGQSWDCSHQQLQQHCPGTLRSLPALGATSGITAPSASQRSALGEDGRYPSLVLEREVLAAAQCYLGGSKEHGGVFLPAGGGSLPRFPLGILHLHDPASV